MGDYKSFVVADIPGLIEKAAQGKGLGSRFLKHVERTQILAFLLDPSQSDVSEQYSKLVKELEEHDKSVESCLALGAR